MFLRPRRWGKSTFLNMLAAYYDVKTKDSFEELFGGLSIGKAPTKSRNSHLILLFDFSTIRATGSLEQIEQSIFDSISGSLRRFLLKYRDILGDALPEEYIIPGRAGASLMNVLVSKFGSGVYHGTDRDNRISFTVMAIPLSLASTSTMPRPTLV
jgi:Predicted AAA-ATPase